MNKATNKKTKPNRSKKVAKLPNIFKLTEMSFKVIWRNKKILLGITVIYGLLNLLLVQGLVSSSDISNVKNNVNSGSLGSLASGLGGFIVLVSTAGSGSSQSAGGYQIFLSLITSLAVIWALRQIYSKSYVSIKTAYYKGNAQIIPFILVLLVIFLQLLPLLFGSLIYSIVKSNNIASSAAENLIFILILIASFCLTLYWLSSSLFGLYIVSLPNMTPLNSLKQAKQLVKFKRLYIIRKIIFLPVLLIVLAAVVMLPIILWLTFLASWTFFILTMFALVGVHTYMYTLYRELLNATDDTAK